MNKNNIKNKLSKNIAGSEITIILAYVVLCIIFGLLSNNFFTIKNFINIGIYSSIIGITASAATIVLICGCIDISVGSIMGLAGMICSIMLKSGISVWLTIVVTIISGFLAGAINGVIVSYGKIVPMIATLATMSIYRGIAYLTNNGISIVIDNNNFKWVGRGYLGPIPFLLILLLLFYLIMFYITKYTSFGRKTYATGANKRASYLAGINTNKVTFIVYAICGTFAGISGMLMSAQAGAGIPAAGTGYEMTIISACVLGGTSINGGKGNVWGTLIGVLLLTTISNGLTMLGVSSFWQEIITGAILLLAVFVDVIRSGGYKKV